MRPLDEKGAWLPKSKKEYVLDENGEKIRLPSGRYKTRKVDLVDWNHRENAEVWRRAWADLANEYLEKNNRPERIDHRSYERQGIDQIPTVHVGVSATQMEKKGIVTERGELNRNINAANRILREIRRLVRGLKDWIAELKERKAALLESLAEARAQASEPTIPQLLAGTWSSAARSAPTGLPRASSRALFPTSTRCRQQWSFCGRKKSPPWKPLTDSLMPGQQLPPPARSRRYI